MSGAARRFMRAVHVFDAAPQKHTPVIASAAAIVSASALGLWYAVRIDHYKSDFAHIPMDYKIPEEFANKRD
ncbi:hypothetical protein FNF27_03237 [Cafeteria roenbergensis]|uniref:Uncharacterized protein n=1 Tax=Cafeteria roenbergensis TaxID=33653 RepID=A0A5A8D1J8_CAFRO|nr:hypothetical protein FNF29_04295 [Cafeteria roenbergensis]KAA0159263.1 hypothetical protein FNF28_05938 [Cafeteria roenbergensis]KAA0164733.1 hypothetical protein FNF31_02270 [Cafeteria roenbergensis]KAA0175229.1 hypothetical protein FNF27_03237 [Cafeteria roenbergensis]|eukprot:KAA0151889.1 hypothetical protein FNF29_04295 [Cafeteria roenbergensis]